MSMVEIVEDEVGAAHQLYVLDVDAMPQPDRVRRTAEPHRAATDTEEMFTAMKAYFTLPEDDEGLNVIVGGWV